MRVLALALACVVTMSTSAVGADKDKVYKWVDEKGVVHYGDKPPDDSTKPAKLPPLQTYRGGTPPDLGKYQTAPRPGAPAQQPNSAIQILTPAPDETFRDTDEKVTVSVSAPNLVEGARLMYYLDGRASAGPTSETSWSLTNVERGTHTVAVAAIDLTGKEVARSAAVTFYMKPPMATKRH